MIEQNPVLEEIGMPNLMTVSLKALADDFRFFATYIVNNPNFCIPVHQIESWCENGRVFIPQMIYCGIEVIEATAGFLKFKVENSSKIYCNAEKEFNATMPFGCQVLDLGIWLTYIWNDTQADRFNKAMETVEFVFGPVVVRDTNIKTLSFPNLKTIYNILYDKSEQTGWGYQALQFRYNTDLTEISMPKLEKVYHYGSEAFIKIQENPFLKCSPDLCEKFASLMRFELDNCCGMIPNFNKGYKTSDFSITIIESTCCAILTFLIYGNVLLTIYKSGFSVSYFQFSMLVYFCLSSLEAVYNVLNNVKFIDGLGYPWFIGMQFLFFSSREQYFYQAVNIIYVNRISLLLSCCIYRTVSFVSYNHAKTAMGLSFIIFIVSNIWSFNVLLQNGSKFAYGLYLINWAAFAVSIITSVFLLVYLRKNFRTYSELRKHQNRLSVAFFLQTLLAFIFCGFPENVIVNDAEKIEWNQFLRKKKLLEFYYGSIITRWHYILYAIVIRYFLHEMLAKVDIRSDTVVTRRTKAAVEPAAVEPAAVEPAIPIQGIE